MSMSQRELIRRQKILKKKMAACRAHGLVYLVDGRAFHTPSAQPRDASGKFAPAPPASGSLTHDPYRYSGPNSRCCPYHATPARTRRVANR